MKTADFYNLKIRDKIHFNDGVVTVSGLVDKQESPSGDCEIYFSEGTRKYEWHNICEYCSLEALKEKKKYWQWKACGVKSNPESIWTRLPAYIDEKGFDTSGRKYFNNWDDMYKSKIEDDFVEV